MPSKNERARWSKWHEDVTERMSRMKDSINRLVLITTEAMAALEEIAAMGGYAGDDEYAMAPAVNRAQEALDAIKGPAAATIPVAEESRDEQDPTDPRRNK